MIFTSVKQLLKTIKAEEKYAWPGGYPLYIFDWDGLVCWDCLKSRHNKLLLIENISKGCVGIDVLWEKHELCCSCGEVLPSAYGEEYP
jgi:hypothetical protein